MRNIVKKAIGFYEGPSWSHGDGSHNQRRKNTRKNDNPPGHETDIVDILALGPSALGNRAIDSHEKPKRRDDRSGVKRYPIGCIFHIPCVSSCFSTAC